MLTSASAQTHRNEIDSRLNPGFRHAEPARLLADAYAIASAVAVSVESRETKRDCLDLAIQIERYLLDTLSELRVTRDDVTSQFDELREEREAWPESISDAAWERLGNARTLRDIADVICGGGDYWEAIRVALWDEFEPRTSEYECWPRTLYLAFDGDDWRESEALAADMPQQFASRLNSVLERVKARTDERFAMVVWSVQDVLDGVARRRDESFSDMGEATWEQAGVTRDWVEEVVAGVESAMSDRMTEKGWEVLEDAIGEALDDDDE